jgi:phage FluMu protein Com
MISLISSSIGVLFVLIGALVVWIMLEIQGNPKKREKLKTSTRTHKVLGYIFIFMYAIMCIFMIIKVYGYSQEFSSRATIHIVLAIFLTPMILLKLGIVKRFKRLFAYLPVLGSLIFATAFALNGITAGYYFLHQSKIQYTTISEADMRLLDEHIGRELLLTKCNKCHSLERVQKASKTSEGWIKTVNRMAEKDVPNIRPFDVKQIAFYLIKEEEDRQISKGPKQARLSGAALVQSKCTRCHTLDRIYKKKRERDEWIKFIGRMIENAEEFGIIDFLEEKEKIDIIDFLAHKT